MSDTAFIEKIRTLSINVKGGTPKFFLRRGDFAGMFQSDDARHQILKDRAMYKTVTEGNASDKSLTRDVTAFENEKKEKEKQKAREVKAKRVKKLKDEYRRKYKCEA